jgi:hypothetical protein
MVRDGCASTRLLRLRESNGGQVTLGISQWWSNVEYWVMNQLLAIQGNFYSFL